MLVCIPNVLTKAEVLEFRQLMDDACWKDGRRTAGSQSAMVKRNVQLPPDGDLARSLGRQVIKALTGNPQFLSAAIPLSHFSSAL